MSAGRSCSGSHSRRQRHKHETTAHFTPKLKVLLFPATFSPNTEPSKRTCLLYTHLDLCCQYRMKARWRCNQVVLPVVLVVEKNRCPLGSLKLLQSFTGPQVLSSTTGGSQPQAPPTNQPIREFQQHTDITSLWLHSKQEVPQNGQKKKESCKVQSENENVSKMTQDPHLVGGSTASRRVTGGSTAHRRVTGDSTAHRRVTGGSTAPRLASGGSTESGPVVAGGITAPRPVAGGSTAARLVAGGGTATRPVVAEWRYCTKTSVRWQHCIHQVPGEGG